MTGLLAEWYERCELEAQNPLPMTAVIHISQQWMYRPANVGMAHSNQRNVLEHSEEPYNKYRYLRLIPNLQLASAGRTGTANGPQIALGPHFAQVCIRGSQKRNLYSPCIQGVAIYIHNSGVKVNHSFICVA